ncbi:BspA family leucine-rich repeat surface protein [Levilactobacillus tujiorum]|uniref:BspA family leucine-rich repeat surface protein n=1 Tax=Levilactobacillus tujiorum TaxID=2912243 RepID=UPI001457919B|nr:BspA family leucine-rich repeat surface protein [Levilactobacillus tujiorum]
MKPQREKRKRSHKITMTKVGLLTGMVVWGTIMATPPAQAEMTTAQETVTSDTSADSQVITGQTGTCKWTLQDGVLKFEAGNFARNGDWLKYKDQVQEIQFTGRVVLPEMSGDLFSYLPKLQRFLGTENVDTSQVTNMYGMFMGDEELTALDLRTWDVSHVWAMRYLFRRTPKLRTLQVGTWETSSLTWTESMFSECGATDLDLRHWDVSQVTDMGNMFYGMRNLSKLDLTGWKTDNVTTMQWMFGEDSQLTDLRLGSNWQTGQVTRMDGMFMGTGLRTLDLHSWDVSRVTNMTQMFWRCYYLTTLNVTGWQTGNVTNMAMMFRYVPASKLAVEQWDVSQVKRMEQMFAQTAASTLDLSRWDVRNVVNFEQMFGESRCTDIRVDGWQTSHAGSMQKMFIRSKAKILNLAGFDMSQLDYQGSGSGYWTDGRVELMLNGMPNLQILKLGTKTQLKDDNGYTVGLDTTLWQAVDQGTIAHPQGRILTGKELETTYTAAMADTYVRVYQAAPVTVTYRDLTTNEEIQPAQQLAGIVGTPFEVKTEVAGYQYQKADGPLTGTFQSNPQKVTLYYLKTAADLGSVTFRFVNDAGQQLRPDDTQIGKVGQPFVIAPPEIEGYHLHVDEPLPSQGLFTTEPQVLTFLYRQLGQVNVTYVDEAGRKIVAPRNFEGEYGTQYQLDQFLKGLDSELADYIFVKSMGPVPGVYGPGITRVGLVFKKKTIVTPNPDPDPQPTPDPNPGPNPLPTPEPNPEPEITPPAPGGPDETGAGGAGDLVQGESGGQGASAVSNSRPQPQVTGHSERPTQNQKLPATSEATATKLVVLGTLLLAGLGRWWYRRH